MAIDRHLLEDDRTDMECDRFMTISSYEQIYESMFVMAQRTILAVMIAVLGSDVFYPEFSVTTQKSSRR
jgi:hypothetical protein